MSQRDQFPELERSIIYDDYGRTDTFNWDIENGRYLPFYFIAGELDGDKIARNGVEWDRYLTKHTYDVIIVGGGVASMLQPLFKEISDRLPSCCINKRCQEIPLVPARYGADAGIAGGAALCFQTTSNTNGVTAAILSTG